MPPRPKGSRISYRLLSTRGCMRLSRKQSSPCSRQSTGCFAQCACRPATGLRLPDDRLLAERFFRQLVQVGAQTWQVDHVVAVVAQQELERCLIAFGLIAVPEPRRVPSRQAGGAARDADRQLNFLQSAFQSLLPAVTHEIM